MWSFVTLCEMLHNGVWPKMMGFRHKNTLFHQKFLYLFKHDSKKNSVIEVVFDVVLGCGIATALNYAILPHYIDTIQSGDPLGMFSISIWYVAISFARKYAIRRWFAGMKRK